MMTGSYHNKFFCLFDKQYNIALPNSVPSLINRCWNYFKLLDVKTITKQVDRI